jgi:Cu/Zn superoxide dismutase
MSSLRHMLTVGFMLVLGTALVATPADASKAQARIQTGSITALFTFKPIQEGMRVSAQVQGLTPNEQYAYHIHVNPVPDNGDCAGTGGHYDPYGRGSNSTCTHETLENCEMGDLSGKWGKLNANSIGVVDRISYIDPTLSLTGEHSIVGRSVVIHNPKGDRIACGTIVKAKGASTTRKCS